MKKIFAVLSGLMLALPFCASADDRELLVVGEMIEINAKPDVVWNIVKAFDGLVNWHPAFSSSPLVKGKNGHPGAVRALTIKDGPTFTEELLAYSDARMAYTYDIVESPLPLDHYQSSMSVKGNSGGGTTVAWIGTFTRKNPRDNVAEAEGDDAMVKLIIGAYQAGLETVKKMAEGK
ncbi:MAG TPA: SRPBCC family protein [Burkholderiales bacterium]|nr:SRPBCC family protein [Burkholderiales bacterium]